MPTPRPAPSLFDKLVSHFDDSQQALADAFDVSPQVISNWKRRGIPIEWALPIEEKTRGFVTAKEVLEARRVA